MKKKNVYAGFGAQEELLYILEKDCATHNNAKKFRTDAKEFQVTLLKKMLNKNPILFSLVKYASVLDPKVLVLQPLNICKSLFQRLPLLLFI